MSGCAVSSDGSLLSPSKIDFFNDPDDIVPISGPSSTATTAPPASTGSSATTLDSYFASHQPAVKLAGVRRTTRALKPSARVRDAADALSDSAVAGKRKANHIPLHRRVARKIVPDSDDSDGENDSDVSMPSLKDADDTGEATDCDGTDTDEAQGAYDLTKEMGDADREVSLKFQCHIICIERYRRPTTVALSSNALPTLEPFLFATPSRLIPTQE
jgi:hypothetical protein